MSSISLTLSAIQIALLLYVACTDIAARLIPNAVCLAIAALSLYRIPFDLQQAVLLLGGAAFLFVALLVPYNRGYVGGGDVKLLAALAIGLSLSLVFEMITVIAMAGGVLALVHVLMRSLPYPALPPVGSSMIRRVYAIERWRNVRRAPLPFGVAIACGGIWTVLSYGG